MNVKYLNSPELHPGGGEGVKAFGLKVPPNSILHSVENDTSSIAI